MNYGRIIPRFCGVVKSVVVCRVIGGDGGGAMVRARPIDLESRALFCFLKRKTKILCEYLLLSSPNPHFQIEVKSAKHGYVH